MAEETKLKARKQNIHFDQFILKPFLKGHRALFCRVLYQRRYLLPWNPAATYLHQINSYVLLYVYCRYE